MRLYLSIERNSLPPVKTVWPLPTNDQKYTTADLLEAINAVFPLEAEQWGLEDYVVTLNGHELLHYHEIKAVCNDGEQVTIRPLQTIEVRARTISGRAQISSDGRHLIDGIAFGKPALKSPVRPVIRIPPRKRMKLIDNGENEIEETDRPTLLLTNGDVIMDEDSDKEEDEDFMDEEDSDEEDETSSSESSDESSSESDSDSSSSDDSSDSEIEHNQSERARVNGNTMVRNRASKTLHGTGKNIQPEKERIRISSFSSTDVAPKDGGVSFEQQMRSFAPGTGHVHFDASSDDSESDDDSASKSAQSVVVKRNASHQVENSTPETSSKKRKRLNTLVDPKNNQQEPQKLINHAASESVAVQTNGTKSPFRVLEEKAPKYVGIPGEGKSRTRQRAQRKKDKTRLNHLQLQGLLPSTANFRELRAYENSSSTINHDDDGQSDAAADAIADHAEQLQASTAVADENDAPEEASSKNVNAAAAAGTLAEAMDTSDDSSDSKEEAYPATERAKNTALSMIPPSVTRRPKSDVNAVNRMIFNSLGFRVPKTAEEKQATQIRLAGLPRATLQVAQNIAPALAEEVEEAVDEDWADKIELTAVETSAEDIELDPPPFPFEQHWMSKAVNDTELAEYDEVPFEAVAHVYANDTSPRTSGLNENAARNEAELEEYDEVAFENVEDEYANDIEPRRPRNYQINSVFDGVWFPPVPSLEEYLLMPSLAMKRPSTDSYVAYSDLACDESTGWQPQSVRRVIMLVEQLEDRLWKVRINPHDLPQRYYDDDGNRIFGRFEVDLGEDEETEEELEASKFAEMDLEALENARVVPT